MVNAGRVACIFTPFVLSAASLACLVLIFLGGTSQHNKTLGSFYFLKTDLTNFTLSSAVANGGLTPSQIAALGEAKQDLGLDDFYAVYMWNYCAWNGTNVAAYCSPKKTEFWFNAIEVWNLNTTSTQGLFPKTLTDGLKTYHSVSKYMFVVYAAAFVCSVLTLLIGTTAIFSRWGSFFTTFFASAAVTLTIAASAVSTALFATLDGTLNEVLKEYGIKASLGMPALRATWLAVVFALAAAFFWLLSVCCCSGRSPYYARGGRDTRRVRVENAPYTYERVGSPYLGPRDAQAMPLKDLSGGQQSRQAAYEPFRSQPI